jgi:photosynthetic reaction center cytochrome c subunit
MNMVARIGIGLAAVVVVGLLFTLEYPPVDTVQRGFRGVGMQENYDPKIIRAGFDINQVPDPQPTVDPAGQPSSEAYQNVQVLGDVDAAEFLRLMAAITSWVAPEQGCGYCHNLNNLADDSLYTKRVARRMFQMTRQINANWQTHVQNVGVTCYTCHRGHPVPSQIWFNNPGPPHPMGVAETGIGKNLPAPAAGLASLPLDPYTPFLEEAQPIRVQSTTALPTGDRESIKQAEWTYALMMHFANSLGVNCTYCHNSRAFSDWSQSTPQRVTAWYGIRMVRDQNVDYMASLEGTFPHYRLGQDGDVAKVNCATCHQGAYKPLYGVSMVKDYPELEVAGNQAVPTYPEPPTLVPAATADGDPQPWH